MNHRASPGLFIGASTEEPNRHKAVISAKLIITLHSRPPNPPNGGEGGLKINILFM